MVGGNLAAGIGHRLMAIFFSKRKERGSIKEGMGEVGGLGQEVIMVTTDTPFLDSQGIELMRHLSTGV